METMTLSQKKAHFLGLKIKTLRKKNKMTLEDLVFLCFRKNEKIAPSVSYLSLIENGKRQPSESLLTLFSEIFQKEVSWFFDDSQTPEGDKPTEVTFPTNLLKLEPGVLFSKQLLERAIPELLTQSGTSGRQFAHTLIRTYQEQNKNKFTDIEKEAEKIGVKRFPVSKIRLDDLFQSIGLTIKWFDKPPFLTKNDAGFEVKTLFRSFYEKPETVYINRQLQDQPERLNYEMALHIAHKVLHGGDGMVSSHATGGEIGGSPRPSNEHVRDVSQKEILLAWRDFECSFFASALLCPRIPFRKFLIRNGYSTSPAKEIGLTPSIILRRMTAVSPYEYWHYFDIYPPGVLRVAYCGNGIPLPWGSMISGAPACKQWALFRFFQNTRQREIKQISLLKQNKRLQLYGCIATRTKDAAGNPHIVSAGIDLLPMMKTQGYDIENLIQSVYDVCHETGSGMIPDSVKKAIKSSVLILNISWVIEALENPVVMICTRPSNCPREKTCDNVDKKLMKRISWVDEIKEEILNN